MLPAKWKLTPLRLKRLLNLYPPNLGAGVRVERFSDDWRSARVRMRLRWYNRNFVGTHFGGSLYSMVDPHLMVMLIQILGPGYLVWDQAAEIEFVKPGRGKVSAQIVIGEEDLRTILDQTASGERCLHSFNLQVLEDDGSLVARVRKVIYVRRKRAPAV